MNYCFGEYILDTQRRELRHQGHRVALRPKVFDVLAYLVRHPDQVVGKQTLLTAAVAARAGESGRAERVH